MRKKILAFSTILVTLLAVVPVATLTVANGGYDHYPKPPTVTEGKVFTNG